MTSFVPEAQAYSYNGNLVLNQIRFIPHVNFGQTSIAHFNEAIYQWNSNAGWALMSRDPISRHSQSIFPNHDDMNGIYKMYVGPDYLASTQRWTMGNHTVEADININPYYPYHNKGASGYFDTWTVFIHEAGHVAGMSHSNYQDAVMYPTIADGVEKRYLHWDDVAGISGLY